MAEVIEYGVAKGVLSALLKSLKAIKNSIKATIEELSRLLKSSAKTGITSVDNVLGNVKVVKTAEGFLAVGDNIPLGRLERIIKAADLDGLADITSSASKVTGKERAAFKEIIGDTAESQLHNLDQLTSTASKSTKYADLNVRGVTSSTSPETLAKLKNIENKFLKYAKPGAAIVLTVGVAYVVVDGLTKATKDRTGCFMVTNINGKTQSCKVSSLTCSSEASDGVLCGAETYKYKLNTMLCLLSLGNPNEENEKFRIGVSELAGIDPNEYMNKFDSIINSQKFDYIFDYVTYYLQDITTSNKTPVCDLPTITDVDKKLPLCRMCDTGAHPMSTTFVDASELADNITFECRNPTILDTIIDIGKSTGKDLLDTITSPIWSFVKPFAIVIGVFVVIAIVISLVLRLVSQSKRSQINNTQQFSKT